MILQALAQYYERKQNSPDPAQHLPAFGWERKEIPFILEIEADGSLVQLRDTRQGQAGNPKKLIGRSFLVPQAAKKTSGVAANLLWDTLEYVLGIDTRGNSERVAKQHAEFRARIESLPAAARQDEGVQAVLQFYAQLQRSRLEAEPAWQQLLEAGNPNISFRLHGDSGLICQRAAVLNATQNGGAADSAVPAMCLITGEIAPIERVHTAIKGVWGAQTSGANIVSFNARAFESYNKTDKQGENAPVSKAAAFAYTTALNHLLSKDSAQRIQVGDASTVIWAERDDELETAFAQVLKEPSSDDPDSGTQAVAALYQALQEGKLSDLEGKNRFHVLGLAPNASRISVRFYHCLPRRALAERILAHFNDLKIARGPNDPEYPSLFRLLISVAVQGKADNIPKNLAGAVVDAILAGPDVLYPSLLLNAAVIRCRADQSISYLRAAIIKACLNRQIRRHLHNTDEKEFSSMLDKENINPAYRLGRLFATLERIQDEAARADNGKLNATIRDRYYGAASSTPVVAFATLLRLKNAHIKKLKSRPKIVDYYEKLLTEVLDPVKDFPSHMQLPDQGRFALGYYHQRQDFFTKNSSNADDTEAETIEEGDDQS